ncbi:hypothetical protein GO755_20540 [Spirosoma sp. HMF4905]|uniref:7-cyano-7-deazaguanine synthase n=1 Tax=Spirosoma arboris TaxID=2682092 RepID=A0A7K1SF55_9BACT|nr:Qat anti-phage system QueC-like protein QatC [Spirosoma arboris]MVM32445.1 hypothetical protein [Spirosoma arboris]
MRKHLIIGAFGPKDDFKMPLAPNEAITLFPLIVGENTLNFGISNALNDLLRLGVYPTEIGLDMLIVAAHIYAADTRISRISESQDTWTRELHLIIPVSDVAVWSNVSAHLVRLLNFLTGDRWEIEFRSRTSALASIISQKPENQPNPPFTKLQLFSGGLDSLIGAINNLEASDVIPLLISHAGDGAASDAQKFCYDALKSHYSSKPFDRLRLWMNISKETFKDTGMEDTTRGRSFLFFALGIFAGTGLNHPFVLEAPENGLIALNVPLDVLRLGSLSTHTTHPFYIGLWNTILTELGIDGRIVNPYWDHTKGEMVAQCKNPVLLEKLLPRSLSCSSPSKGRWKGLGIVHCGYCLPCLIRRASVKSGALFKDSTVYSLADLTSRNLDSLQSEGHQIRSFQLAVRRIKRNPASAKLLIHKSGPLPQDTSTLLKLTDVYKKGMMEVDGLLQGVVTEPKE